MSQAEAPRVYKFVGAFSRKRRRRNVTIGSTAANGRAAVNSPLQVKSPVMPTVPASSFEPVNGEDIDRLTDHSYMPSTQRVSEVHAIPPVTSTNCEVTEENTQPSIEGFYQVQDPNWSCPSLWNPFFDLELPILRPFHHIDGHHQLSVDLSVDGTPTQLLDDSPISNAPQSQDSGDPALHLAEEAGFQPSLPSLGLQGATCDISLTISQLLTRYDQEFCIMPLTHDFEANPFRVDTKTGRGSQLLLHCILALSYKHINRDTGSYANEARTHKRKALQMLRELESVSQSASLEVALLDAVLILMTLDCATSAHGPWTWYLKRAHKMIEAADFASIRKTPRMEACIEILIWWDVTLALTSRQGYVLSQNTITSLFNQDKSRNETFYSVSGCPEPLFLYMIRLGSYAREFEVASNMTCVKLDMAPVLQVEKQIRDWRDPGYESPNVSELSSTDDCESGDGIHHKEDLHHCAEAWRYGLLIYISRVFKWQRNQPVPRTMGFLARRALNHVSCCRYTSMIQKQLLLPVFLAGCETTDEHLRQVARHYCTWWNDQTRYDMFLTTHALLEEVWSNNDPQSWWGSVIDQKSRSHIGMGDSRQYLFG